MMTKNMLKDKFEEARNTNKDIAVELTVPTRTATEIIIVKNDNIDYKLNYYLDNYNDNLELSRFTEIKILNVYLVNWDENKLM